MNLNLHILKEDLSDWHFSGTPKGEPTERTLTGAVYCERLPEQTDPGTLYLLRAELLEEGFPFTAKDSVLCLGLPPERRKNACSLLYTMQTHRSGFELVNAVNECFRYYRNWTDALQRALDDKSSPQTMAELSGKIFPGPIYAQGAFFRVICNYLPESVPELLRNVNEEFYDIQPGMQLLPEEINTLISDPEYLRAAEAEGPTIYSGELYGYRTLFYNVVLHGIFVARVCIDEALRPFTPRDFALIQVFGDYLGRRLTDSEVYSYDRPQELDEVLTGLLDHRLLPLKKIQRLLALLGWDEHDEYTCFTLRLQSEETEDALEPLALQLARLVSQDVYILREDTVVFVFDLTKLRLMREQLYDMLLPHLRDNLMTAGVSTVFRDFKNLYYYYQQALIAEKIGRQQRPTQWYFRFEDFEMEYLLQKSVEGTLPEVLIPEGLKALIAYDRARGHNYTETLRLYLEHDRSIADTIRAGYMHRSTFLYQIGRINEILRMDLDNPEVRLLLRLAFRLINHKVGYL